MVKCRRLCIDLMRNELEEEDSEFAYHGFDFYVREEEAEEMMGFALEELAKLEVPYLRASLEESRLTVEPEVWTKEKIAQSFLDNMSFLEEVKQSRNCIGNSNNISLNIKEVYWK